MTDREVDVFAGRARVRGCRWAGLGALAALAMVSGAAARLEHPQVARAVPSSQVSPDAALLAALGVLRRAQEPSDVLPAGLRYQDPPLARGIIPGLTRLVGSVPGASFYLAVSTPPRGRISFWSVAQGDQVSLVAVSGGSAFATLPYPAADLADPFQARPISVPVGSASSATAGDEAEVVPDWVASVRWRFTNVTGTPVATVNAQPSNNVVLAQLPARRSVLAHTTWFAADGTPVATSDSALVRVVKKRERERRQSILRDDTRAAFTPPARLLAAFRVFAITSRRPVDVGGLRISWPRLSGLPLPILAITASRPRPSGLQLDPADMRQATNRAGVSVWIVPSRQGICVAELDPPRVVPGIPAELAGSGSGAGCSGTLSGALKQGAGLSSCCAKGYSWNYGILPDAHPSLTIRIARHKHIRITPPDGIYIYRTRVRRTQPPSISTARDVGLSGCSRSSCG